MPAPSSPTTQLQTKSVYDPPAADDGFRVLATRYWPRGVPRGVADEYVRALAPSEELLRSFKDGRIDWWMFRKRYLEEMQAPEPQAEVRRLAERATNRTLTLLCVCREDARCHRSLLRGLLSPERATHLWRRGRGVARIERLSGGPAPARQGPGRSSP